MIDPKQESRRLMALAETSTPPWKWDDRAECALYLGLPTIAYVPSRDWPRVLAKWRFACADEMLAEMEAFDEDD